MAFFAHGDWRGSPRRQNTGILARKRLSRKWGGNLAISVGERPHRARLNDQAIIKLDNILREICSVHDVGVLDCARRAQLTGMLHREEAMTGNTAHLRPVALSNSVYQAVLTSHQKPTASIYKSFI